MEVSIRCADVSDSELRTLRLWLTDRDELRGRVHLVHRPVSPGTLGGGMVEALTVAAGSGGLLTAVVSGLVSWIRQRHARLHPATEAVVHLVRSDGASVEVRASVAASWTPTELRTQIEQLVQLLDGGAAATGAGPPGPEAEPSPGLQEPGRNSS